MATEIPLSSKQIADLAIVCNIGSKKLAAVAAAVSCLDPPPVLPGPLQQAIFQALGGNQEESRTLLRILIPLCVVMRRDRLDPAQVFDSIRVGLENASWSQEKLKQWHDAMPQIHSILMSRPVRLVAKVTNLAYDYTRLYRDARIITDVRPVFDDDAISIEAAIVSFTLLLDCFGTDELKTISITLDQADVTKLREKCDRALQKAKNLRTELIDKLGVPTVVSGETRDAAD